MKKFSIKFISFLTVLTVLLSLLFALPASADSASVSLSARNVTVGGTVKVTVRYNSNLSLYNANGTLSYNPAVLQYISGGQGASGSSVKLFADLDGQKSTSFSVNFRALKEGSSNLSVSLEGSDGITMGTASGGATVTVSKPAPSSNANLSSLSVTDASLTPAFSPSVTAYSASVANSVEKTTLKASVADGDATLVGIGEKSLKEGDNSFVITVTASSGVKKSYTVNIRRRLKGELTLEEILSVSVKGEKKKIVQDISALPVINGFSQSTSADYKGTKIGILTDKDGKYKFYYLTNEDGSDPKLYELSGETFKPISAINSNGKTYIVESAPESFHAPDGYIQKIFEFNGKKFNAFGFENKRMKDFYILYCFNGEERQFYNYDSKETVLERFPMFSFEREEVNTDKTVGILEKFNSLNTVSKALIIAGAVAVIVIIVLIIILKKTPKTDGTHSSPTPHMLYQDKNFNSSSGFKIDTSHKFDD